MFQYLKRLKDINTYALRLFGKKVESQQAAFLGAALIGKEGKKVGRADFLGVPLRFTYEKRIG